MTAVATHTITETRLCTRTAAVPMRIRSLLPGRERWDVPVLKGNAPLAAAAQLLLTGEPGIICAEANAVTGRVLIRFNPAQVENSPEAMIRNALSFGPLSCDEMSEERKGSPVALKGLLFAELGCFALKGLLFSGGCLPAGVFAAVFMLFAIHRRG